MRRSVSLDQALELRQRGLEVLALGLELLHVRDGLVVLLLRQRVHRAELLAPPREPLDASRPARRAPRRRAAPRAAPPPEHRPRSRAPRRAGPSSTFASCACVAQLLGAHLGGRSRSRWRSAAATGSRPPRVRTRAAPRPWPCRSPRRPRAPPRAARGAPPPPTAPPRAPRPRARHPRPAGGRAGRVRAATRSCACARPARGRPARRAGARRAARRDSSAWRTAAGPSSGASRRRSIDPLGAAHRLGGLVEVAHRGAHHALDPLALGVRLGHGQPRLLGCGRRRCLRARRRARTRRPARRGGCAARARAARRRPAPGAARRCEPNSTRPARVTATPREALGQASRATRRPRRRPAGARRAGRPRPRGEAARRAAARAGDGSGVSAEAAATRGRRQQRAAAVARGVEQPLAGSDVVDEAGAQQRPEHGCQRLLVAGLDAQRVGQRPRAARRAGGACAGTG